MRDANIYSHLNGLEHLMVHKPRQWQEILNAIHGIDANLYTKVSKDKSRLGETVYAQTEINKRFKELLNATGWQEMRTPYYVTDNLNAAKVIAKKKDREEQKAIIREMGGAAYSTYNQVDFVKDRIAVEVQFGKYFSVAYDLHVKHTFFFLMDDIDVGIEIIPTHAMQAKMDTGVSWFENEVANVIREGRSNPSVPLVIIGIEPDEIIE